MYSRCSIKGLKDLLMVSKQVLGGQTVQLFRTTIEAIMAPKRHRVESPQAPEQEPKEFDNTLFVSADAEKYFHNMLHGKTFVVERGLRLDARLDGDMMAMIRQRGWLLFTDALHAALISTVQEFYANTKEGQDRTMIVRGCQVSYTSQSINALFNLPNVRVDDLDWIYAWCYDLDEVSPILCKPGTVWETKH